MPQIATFLFVILHFSVTIALAQFPASNYHPIIGQLQSRALFFKYYPSVKLGTHVNELSLNASPFVVLPIKKGRSLQLRLTSSLRFNASYLGIPGGSIGTVNKGSVIFSWGGADPKNVFSNSFLHPGLKRHNLEYYYMHYASTDMTQQFSGGISYEALINRINIKFSMENDFMAFLGLDEFRTGGAMLDVKKSIGGRLYGVGAGALLWTGSTKGLANLDFGQEYDMSNQFGADYSHGIAFLSFHFEGMSLRLGYDSEAIRTGIQDNLHRLIDDGTISGGRLRRNRIYLQLSVLNFDFLY